MILYIYKETHLIVRLYAFFFLSLGESVCVHTYIYIYILDSHMAPYGASAAVQSTVRNSAVISKERNVGQH